VAIWEPDAGNAARALAEDRIEFPGDGIYRELFNLNATASHLADPAMRRRIVRFVRAILDAAAAMKRDGARARTLAGAASGFSSVEIDQAWPMLAFSAGLPSDLLDTLVAEETWLAAQDRRTPRSREALSLLIHASVYEEARRR
jgi:sulfonate transport system substrate-binding protein